MTQVLRWLAPGEIETDISARVDNGSEPRFALTTYAEECSIASSTITVRDPDGDTHIVGLNRFDVVEEDSIADDPYIWVGRFTERVEKRGRYITGPGRDLECTLEDMNNTVSRYIIGLTEDANREAEDHSDRIAWLLGTEACALLTDTSLVLTTTSVSMPAYDYTGMSPQQVIDDCARASGYQNFVWYNGVTDELGLVYAKSAGDWLDSTLRLSNVISEVDDSTTFYLGSDAALSWDPSRIASHVFARGDGVTTFRELDATADLFGRTDKAMDFPTVRSVATLNTRVDRSLANDLDTETTTVKGTVYLPSTHASMFKAGYRFLLHATHLTGFQDDFAYVRLVMTTHELLTPTVYKVEFEAEPLGEVGLCTDFEFEPTPTGDYEPLNDFTTEADNIVYYWRSGIFVPVEPTPDYEGSWNFPVFGTGGSADGPIGGPSNRARFIVVGAGTLTIHTEVWADVLGGAVDQEAFVYHEDDEIEQTIPYSAGDDIVIDISTHAGTECIHWIDIGNASDPGDHSLLYAGASWVSAEV